jgi:transposase
MNTEMTITTERIDDFVLLITMMMEMDLPTILDRHIPRHWLQEGLSWGWVTTIWLAHILSQGDHRKLTVRDWVGQAHTTLEATTGVAIRDTDFTDDRLTIVLRELSKVAYWHAIERDLSRQMVRVYDLEADCVRVDATTISGYHSGDAQSLFQYGHSKDDATLRQIKVMVATMEPGLLMATDVVSGERADDGLYIPIIDRVVATLPRPGLLFVGDCKMSAWDTRVHLRGLGQHYLAPLTRVGTTAQELPGWIAAAVTGAVELTPIYAPDAPPDAEPLAEGYELTRPCTAQVDDRTLAWTERVLVVRSPAHAQRLTQQLEQRLATATAKLQALTPPRGRGKRQIREEAELITKADAIVEQYHVAGLLTYTFAREVECHTQYIGRGRGGPNRPTRTVERVRYQITAVTREAVAIAAQQQTYGWRAYVTDVPVEHLSLSAAVWTYREEWRVEHSFHLLKDAPLSIAPMFVQRDDQIQGLTHLLSLAVRVLTLLEFVARRALQRTQTQLTGLYAQNPKQATAKPTTKRLLQAFANITLTIIQFSDRTVRHITPLSQLQEQILALFDFSPDIYYSLVANST